MISIYSDTRIAILRRIGFSRMMVTSDKTKQTLIV